MNSHATSILRGCRIPLGKFMSLALTAIMLLLTLVPQTALAQIVPPPPNALPLTATTAEDTAVTLNTGIPYDIRYAVAIVVPGPAHGTAVGGSSAGNFAITYTPAANETSPVSFSYQICTLITAVCGQSALATVTITPVNDGPQAGVDNVTTNQDQSVLIDVLANDNGGPNEPGDFASLVGGGISTPASGTAVIEGNQIRYTPAAGVCSATPITFTYLAQDSSGLQVVGTVSVTVRCPGTPLLKLSEPYNFSNHTFMIDVVLESADVNVAALDFYLAYNACLTDPDVPTNNMLADDVTNMPTAPLFLSQVQDQTYANRRLHFVTASTTNPASVLAGPDASPSRTIATIQFKTKPNPNGCSNPVLFDLEQPAGFTGTGGTAINGVVEDKTTSLADANVPPADILLSNHKVPEGSPTATYIGKFSTVDADTGDTFTYSMIVPNGTKFFISPLFNDELIVGLINNTPAGFYDITVQSRDNYGATVTKIFAIEITNVNRAPNAVNDGPSPVITVRGRTTLATLLANDSDPDDTTPGDGNCTSCSIQSVTQPSKGTVTNNGLSVTYIATTPGYTGPDTFNYTLTDNDPTGSLTDSALVTVQVERDLSANNQPVQYGDCNKSNVIEAGDLTATGLELFDGDGSHWYNADQGTYAFSPYGCNSNVDPVIDAGDIACTAQKIFNNAYICGNVMASSATTASLAVGSALSAAPGSTIQVPVVLNTAGHSIAAAAFALDFNAAALSFDSTDADGDGLPDAVSLNIPASLMKTASYNAAESRIEIVMTGVTTPFALLADGTVATVSLTVKDDVSLDETAIALTNSSLGSDEGQSVPLEVTDGSIQITSQPTLNNRVLLPLIRSR